MNKTVLIIGASGDIGRIIAGKLANEGYQLILHCYKNKQVIDQLMVQKHPSVLSCLQADLSDTEQIKMFIEKLVFPIDSVVFASGDGNFGMFQDTLEEEMDRALKLHVKAPWLITKYLIPAMIQKKSGNIIFITSIWGNIGASHEVIYSSVKGAQDSFVKALAKEVAPSGISVNAVSPGFIDTKMNNHLSREEKKEIIQQIPMNRAGTPAEIAHTVNFLMDDKSNYIQGQIIQINGAW